MTSSPPQGREHLLKDEDFNQIDTNNNVVQNKTQKHYCVRKISYPRSQLRSRPVETMTEAYIKLQDQIPTLVKVHGYLYPKSSRGYAKPEDDQFLDPFPIWIIYEKGYESLAFYLMRKGLTKAQYLKLATTIGSTLNRLYFEHKYILTTISSHDVLVHEQGNELEFKLLPIRNRGSASKTEVSPEEYKAMMLPNRQINDSSKHLNFSFGLVLLIAGAHELAPMKHRYEDHLEDEIDQTLYLEKAIVESLIEKIGQKYNSGSSSDQLFMKRLKASLEPDFDQRKELDIWIKDDIVLGPEVQPNLQTVLDVSPLAIPDPSNPSSLNHQPASINNASPPPEGQGFVNSRSLKYEIPQNSDRRPTGGIIQKICSKFMKDFDWDEMSPFSLVVGIFCGMVFIAVLTTILLVSG